MSIIDEVKVVERVTVKVDYYDGDGTEIKSKDVVLTAPAYAETESLRRMLIEVSMKDKDSNMKKKDITKDVDFFLRMQALDFDTVVTCIQLCDKANAVMSAGSDKEKVKRFIERNLVGGQTSELCMVAKQLCGIGTRGARDADDVVPLSQERSELH